MPKSKQQKRDILQALSAKLERSKSVIFAKFDKLSVSENNDLRQKLKDESNEYYVIKKTLLQRALDKQKIEGVDVKAFDGRVAAVFGYEDEVSPAKVVADFKKSHEEQIGFVGGILEKKFLDANAVDRLSKLPSKEELYAKVVGSLNAPVSGFVNVLAGNLRGLVTVLKAIEDKKATN